MNWKLFRPKSIMARRGSVCATMQDIYGQVHHDPKCIVFTEKEEEKIIRVVVSYVDQEPDDAVPVRKNGCMKLRNRQVLIGSARRFWRISSDCAVWHKKF